MDDAVALKINGQIYTGWTDIKITRSLTDCASVFDISVTERWAGMQGASSAWQIQPFNTATVTIGGDTVITGYVDVYEPTFGAESHTVRIAGRSKTCDLVDCMPDISGGTFYDYKLDAIARAVTSQFGINVQVEADVGEAFPIATFEQVETAFAFLSRLARLRSLNLTDNANGDLVLTTAGARGKSSGFLIEGQNILSASAKLSGSERFKDYVVYSQTPLAFDGKDVQTSIKQTWTDPNVPRYRRHAELAEDPLDSSMASNFAKWRALHNYAISTEATISVQGFRQPDGTLWEINDSVSVKSPRLALDRQMLIGKVTFSMSDSGGRQTELLLAPPEAFMAGPGPNGATGKSAYVWHEGEAIKGDK